MLPLSSRASSARSSPSATRPPLTCIHRPFYTFHDTDVAPAGSTFKESCDNLDVVAKKLEAKQKETGIKLLWGTVCVGSIIVFDSHLI
jgi:xylose isomerase